MTAFLALLCVSMGVPIVLVGLGVLKPDPDDIHAPLWVVGACGLAFTFAGASLGLSARWPDKVPFTIRALQYWLGVATMALMALAPTWVAFGGGERAFTSSAFGVALDDQGDGLAGRIAFGFGALLIWLLLIPATLQGWRHLLRQRPS